ncbi:hypothetical protein [Thiocapsa rosea]|uniref:HicA-like toxin of HicAB toxin-antitoxin system n=1 Tax=Thiocapsa rosea TaxID=69360 RepID=A0A495UR44_9GAMM|nr:hypothetical protein [Thiocapsa rosea]RKT37868.1 hypothetical protein BDD21_5379 [Thiocapsa rosea]
MMVSTNPDVRALVRWALKQYPWLCLEPGSKHWRLRSERSQDFTPIPVSPSEFKVVKQLRAQIRRLAQQGRGLIDSKRR